MILISILISTNYLWQPAKATAAEVCFHKKVGNGFFYFFFPVPNQNHGGVRQVGPVVLQEVRETDRQEVSQSGNGEPRRARLRHHQMAPFGMFPSWLSTTLTLTLSFAPLH